ncbi:MAG: hypothetical protein WCG91_01525 [Candidatus Shapirobacteria bacterium]
MNILIILFITASYFFGARAIYKNKYYPNVYSRVIWSLILINNLVSVILLKNDVSVLLLASLGCAGSLLILIMSLKKSKKIFGPIEFISTIFLLVCLGFWIFTKMPFLNLSIGLIVGFIGGIPTFVKVIKNPESEDLLFWLFFALGSIVTLLNSDKNNFSGLLFSLYYLTVNGGMALLCLRRYIK